MINRNSVLSLALLVTVVSVASSVLSQEIKPGVSSLIAQLSSPGRREQLEQQGNRDGYQAGRTGLDANPRTGITALGLTDPAEQKVYSDAYSNGFLQARLELGIGGSPTTSPTTSSTPITSPIATISPAPTLSPTVGISPTPTTTPAATISTERRTQLAQQGYQDGYARATTELGTAPQIGIGRLGLINSTEQRIYSSAYTRGYNQYGINQASQTATTSAQRRYQLVRLGYRAGYARARAGLAVEPNAGLNRLGLTDPNEQRVYSNAYNRGYSRFRVDQANRKQPSREGNPITALW